MQTLLDQRVAEAKRGREHWIRFFGEDFELNSDKYIILLPEIGEINKYMMQYLPEFLKKNKSKQAVVLYDKKEIESIIEPYMGKQESDEIQIEKLQITSKECEEILAFYCLYEFTGRLVVGSLEQPEGRTGNELLKNGFTLEELVKHFIYDIREV